MNTLLFGANELFDTCPDGVLISTVAGIRYCNPACQRLFSAAGILAGPGSLLPSALAAISQEESVSGHVLLGTLTCSVHTQRTKAGQIFYLRHEYSPKSLPLERLALLSEKLQEPLTVLMSISQMLPSANTAEKQRRYLAIYNRSCYRILRLSDNLRQLAQLEQPNVCPKSALDMAGLCRELVREVEVPLEELGTSITCSTPASVLLDGNRQLIRQMLLNMISNALQAKATHLALRLDVQKNRMSLVLRDDGTGITPQAMASAYDPAMEEDTLIQTGFGLGVYLSHKIAALHGGTLILVRGEEGSSCSVSLPVLRLSDANAQLQQPIPAYGGGISDVFLQLSDVLPWTFYQKFQEE